jgi:phage N-6-adenine-methyltransferase
MTEPKQKPGRSKQDYGTPRVFLDAVERRFGTIDFDLAAHEENRVCAEFYSPEQDSLSQSWALPGRRVCWLNPPFADLDPWARKVAECRDYMRWTLMLVPASIDAHWYRDHVIGKMMIWGIPRIQFVGTTANYPKALMLLGAGYGVSGHAYWRWNAGGATTEARA